MKPVATQRDLRLATQATETALAAPVVIAHRLARMATANITDLSQRDRMEFQRMSAEKIAAFGESWQAMALQTMKSSQQLGLSLGAAWWRSALQAWPAAAASGSLMNPFAAWAAPSHRTLNQLQAAQMRIWSKGLAPVHQRAVANAKRLNRSHRTRPR